MHDTQFGRLVRVLRQRRRWRQQDLADHAGVGRTVVVDLEAGRLGGMRLGTQRQLAAALGFALEVTPRGLGSDADHVLDQGHAMLMGFTENWLQGLAWATKTEVTYSEFGERGSIDILCWHAATATVLVVEIKTELLSIEATLRKLDEKVRLAPRIAATRFHWQAKTVGRLLVLPDIRSERQRVAVYGAVLDRAFPVRSYAARRWCRTPIGPVAALIFLARAAGRPLPRATGRIARVRPKLRPNVAAKHANSGFGRIDPKRPPAASGPCTK